MSWGDIFFGFRGRINRKTYWFASLLVAIAGLLFNGLLAYLATGNPIAPEVWQRPPDKSGMWVPVWIAYFAFLAWPSTALAVKRLHDRDRPARIWYVYYAASLLFGLLPLNGAAGAGASAAVEFVLIAFTIFVAYIFFELGVLRGTVGPNEYGPDTLPPEYRGGDYNFWSWMLALEGRITRRKWWLGFLILLTIFFATSVGVSVALNGFFSRHPEFEQNFSNPEWLDSDNAQRFFFQYFLWMLFPMLLMLLVAWSFIALGIKRLHDRGLSSWLILVVILPFIGVFAVASPALAAKFELGEGAIKLALLLLAASAIWSILQFGILTGETGPNRHGPDPRAR